MSRRPQLLALLLAGAFAGPALAGFPAFAPHGGTPLPPPGAAGGGAGPWIEAFDLGGARIEVDGRLDDEAWERAPSAQGFRVWDPDRGAEPSEQTVFKVAYDRHAVYFAVACLEKDPARISSRLARRDRFSNSDLVSVYLDPYHDHTTGYNFRVNPLGVQEDAYMFNDGERDSDWDGVWEAETWRDGEGWYAEMRIPFSTIRFRPGDTPGEAMTWGLQVYRYMHGRGEDTAWVTWDREARGFVSRFGELRGIRDVPAPRQLEVMPYLLQSATDPAVEGVPDALDTGGKIGADLKYGVTADLTLNATLQPDFGQVESDPAVLNLSPFETFYSEKRPFFVEGSRYFQQPQFNLFYSRRIGTGEENSRIRFAGKLTGKTKGGLSVAALAATTDVVPEGRRAWNLFETGEQPAHFLVGRIGQESDDGNHRVNFMQTAVVHEGSAADYGQRGSREAYTSGADFDLNFRDRRYNIRGSFVESVIAPEEDAADPAAGQKRYGTGGNLELQRLGGAVRGGLWGRWESGRLDLNDVGFISSPDEIGSGVWLHHPYNPDGESGRFNRGDFNFNLWKSWLYSGRSGRDAATGDIAWSYDRWHRQFAGVEASTWLQFRTYREVWFGTNLNFDGTQRWETRGGPLISEPLTYGGWWGASTDSRKHLYFVTEGNYFRDTADNVSWNEELNVHWNQSSALNHEVGIAYRSRSDDTQYLETVDLAARPGGAGIGGRSYVFGMIDQRTLDLTLRSSILFSRNQSLELYAQPFITTGDYTNARELARADSYDLVAYAEPGYEVSENDFRYTAVNLNAVYRWEFHPGSTFYLVWTHTRESFDERAGAADPAGFDNRMSTESLFDNEAQNILRAKLSYRFAW